MYKLLPLALLTALVSAPAHAGTWSVTDGHYRLRLGISDAAVARGAFHLLGTGSSVSGPPPPVMWQGDIRDLSWFYAGETVSPMYFFGTLRIGAIFGVDQSYAISFKFTGLHEESEGSLTNLGYDITYGTDDPAGQCRNSFGYSHSCSISARYQVPAPAVWPVMAMAALAGAWRRGRRA